MEPFQRTPKLRSNYEKYSGFFRDPEPVGTTVGDFLDINHSHTIHVWYVYLH